MLDLSRRDRVGLGLIGLGPSWEQRYRETLARLQKRLTIRLVYDPVTARAKSVAAEFKVDIATSLRQILNRPTLQGLLVLDPGWWGAGALRLIAGCGKPVYLAGAVLLQTDAVRQILDNHSFPPDAGIPGGTADDRVMPELGLRFTPAGCRLRELIATKLGAVKQIVIECDLSASISEVAQLIDWCSHIFGNSPLPAMNRDEGISPGSIRLHFPPSAAGTHRTATLRQRPQGNSSVHFEVECDRGDATLIDRTRILWRTPNNSADELLTDERTETEILIDQFCRRAVGGLNPVGRLSEYLRAVEIVESIRR